MTQVRDFLASLARAGKSAAEIQKLADAAYGDKSLGLCSIYLIIKKVKVGENTNKQRHLSAKKIKRTADIVAAVAADVEEDLRVNCKDLASAHGVSNGMMHNILRPLGLVKKSARWVLKLLSEEQKQE
jgi:hypothetical protein